MSTTESPQLASACTVESIVIATRESPLALWQANHIKDALMAAHPKCQVSLLGMTTKGDKILDKSLSKVGGKGLFVKELELALMDGRADIAVHSGKDVPMRVPEGMALQIVDQRADPRDALVLSSSAEAKSGAKLLASLDDLSNILPQGAVVGTSSLRRQCQIKAIRPDIVIKDLRGNLNTRLRKLDEGEFDAIVLAVAGLERLGFKDRISATFSPDLLLPAVAQGALAIEYASDRAAVMDILLQPLKNQESILCVAAERAFNLRLEGSCQTPLAGHVRLKSEGGRFVLEMRALVGASDGAEILRSAQEMSVEAASLSTDTLDAEILEGAEQLGLSVAENLLAMGADRLLAIAQY